MQKLIQNLWWYLYTRPLCFLVNLGSLKALMLLLHSAKTVTKDPNVSLDKPFYINITKGESEADILPTLKG